jgi:hypothetical protein
MEMTCEIGWAMYGWNIDHGDVAAALKPPLLSR